MWNRHGCLTRYIKLRVAHVPECREGFPSHQLQRQALVSDPCMQNGTCVTHVPWCMSGSLTHGGGENVPGIPGACAARNFTYLARCPWIDNIAITIQSKRKRMMTSSNGNILRLTGPLRGESTGYPPYMHTEMASNEPSEQGSFCVFAQPMGDDVIM